MFRQRLGCQFVPAFVPVAAICAKYIFASGVRILNHLGDITPIGDRVVRRNVTKRLAIGFFLYAIERHDRPRSGPCPHASHQLIRDSDGSRKPGMPHAFRFNIHLDGIPGIRGLQPIQSGDHEVQKPAMSIDPVSYSKRRFFRREELDGAVTPVGPDPAIVVDAAEALEFIVVIDEVVDAVLPEDDIGANEIEVPIEHEKFLQRAIAAGPISKDFDVEQFRQ